MWDFWSKPTAETFPQTIVAQMPILSKWASYGGPGHWPDADMLPVGYLGPRPGWGDARQSRLTEDETRTLLTLWCIARSPLVLGANLLHVDAALEALLTNREVLAVDQHSRGNHVVIQTEKTVVWSARLDGGGQALAVINVSDAPAAISYPWTDLGLTAANHRVRNLWEKKNQGTQQLLRVTLAPHASAMLRVD